MRLCDCQAPGGSVRPAATGVGAGLFELGIFPQQTEARSLLAVEPHPKGREGRAAVGSRAGRKQTGAEAGFQHFTVGAPQRAGANVNIHQAPRRSVMGGERRAGQGSRLPNVT